MATITRSMHETIAQALNLAFPPTPTDESMAQWELCITEVARALASNNPAFSATRFNAACGFTGERAEFIAMLADEL